MSFMELLFADDAVLIMSDTVENLQNIVDVFVEVTEAFGQEVSIKKTEVMAINVQVHANPFSIFIKGKKLNVVHEFMLVVRKQRQQNWTEKWTFASNAWQELIANWPKMFSMYVT